MSDSLNGRLFYYPVHTEQNECGCRLLQIILSAICRGTVSILQSAVGVNPPSVCNCPWVLFQETFSHWGETVD